MRFYIDTSVWGGYFDVEFEEQTKLFFNEIISNRHTIIASNEVTRELIKANEKVTGFYLSIPKEYFEIIFMDEKVIFLANKYVEEGALTKKYLSDALHIACATIAKADVLVSWNFTHMVNFFRIKQYNEINRKFGYGIVDIRTPKEVINNKNISKAEEPATPYGQGVKTMQLVREIRDELSEEYWKDPQAYLKSLDDSVEEFKRIFFSEKKSSAK